MWVVGFVGMFGMNFQMTSALMAQQEFHRGPQEYGILGTLMAVGSLSGALLAARRRIAPRGRFVVLMASAFGVVEIVTGLMPNYWAYAAMLPVLGFVALMTLTASNATIQLGVDPRLRGRVMALYMMVLLGGTPIGSPILGWVGEVLGPRWTLIGGGAATTIGVLGSALVLSRVIRARQRREGRTVGVVRTRGSARGRCRSPVICAEAARSGWRETRPVRPDLV